MRICEVRLGRGAAFNAPDGEQRHVGRILVLHAEQSKQHPDRRNLVHVDFFLSATGILRNRLASRRA